MAGAMTTTENRLNKNLKILQSSVRNIPKHIITIQHGKEKEKESPLKITEKRSLTQKERGKCVICEYICVCVC